MGEQGDDARKSRLVETLACKTAAEPDDESEGIFRLALAFGIAGAATVLVTLQPVEDGIMAEFMRDFYNVLVASDGIRRREHCSGRCDRR